MDFGNHSLCVFVNAENQHCREDSRDNGTDQDTEENGGIHDIKAGDELLAGLGKSDVCLVHECAQEGDDGETGSCLLYTSPLSIRLCRR